MAVLGLTIGIAAALGIILGIADRFLKVDEDPRLPEIISMLPNANCGACGNPGCRGMAESILAEESKLSQCKPGTQEMREEIAEYLRSTPNEDGEFVKVKM